jgi:hypothetical protein
MAFDGMIMLRPHRSLSQKAGLGGSKVLRANSAMLEHGTPCIMQRRVQLRREQGGPQALP